MNGGKPDASGRLVRSLDPTAPLPEKGATTLTKRTRDGAARRV